MWIDNFVPMDLLLAHDTRYGVWIRQAWVVVGVRTWYFSCSVLATGVCSVGIDASPFSRISPFMITTVWVLPEWPHRSQTAC